jgi:sugar phosphate isomerase/epimerase
MKTGTFFHHIKMASAERGESLDKSLEWLRGLGYEAAELDADDREGAELLSDHGIAVSSIYRQYIWRDGMDEARMKEHIDLAHKLGTDRIMPIPGLFSEDAWKQLNGKPLGAKGSLDVKKIDGTLGEELRRMVDGMSRLSELARENGLTVVMEDYDDAMSPIATIEGMKIFLDAIPDLKVAFDTGNFAFSGDDVLEAGKEFFARTAHVHMKDRLWSRTGSGDPKECVDGTLLWPCAVCDGDIPMDEILRGLKAVGYDGYLMAEFFGAESYAELIEKSAKNLKARL